MSTSREFPPSFDSQLREIETRAEAAGLEFKRREHDQESTSLRISNGVPPHQIQTVITTPNAAEEFLSIPFERYQPVPGYDAIFCPEDDELEAFLSQAISYHVKIGPGLSPPFRMAASDKAVAEIDYPSFTHEVIKKPGPRATGWPPTIRGHVLRLKGFGVRSATDAKEILDEIGTNVLFELDIRYNLSTELARSAEFRLHATEEQPWPTSDAAPAFPRNSYEKDPVDLYLYGRRSKDMPLLEYLSYYQAIEFYFPRYASEELRRRVERLVKDPRFNPHADRDISRLLDAIADKPGRAGTVELDQIKATLRACVERDDIQDFLDEDERRKSAFTDRRSPLTHRTITTADKNADLRDAAAARVYDIRCRVVHSKDEGEESPQRRLLPTSPEVGLLRHDLALLRFLAVKVLVASSRESTTGWRAAT
jgi:hypothetical protein